MPQDVTFWIFDGVWVEQTDAMFSDPPVTILRGTDSDTGDFRPGGFTATLDNDDDRWRPSNPESSLYGLAARGAIVRVRVNDITRTQAAAVSWKPSKTVDHETGERGKAVVSLVAENMLHRILGWETPLRSAVYRAYVRLMSSLTGYFPCEDGAGAGQLTNAVPGGRAGYASGVTYAGDDDAPAGSAPLMTIQAGGRAGGLFASASTTAGWQVFCTYSLATAPAAIGFLPILIWHTSDGKMWTFDVDDNEYRFTCRDAAGTILYSRSTGFTSGLTGDTPLNNMTIRIKVTLSGGTVTIEPGWYPENAEVLYGITDTFASATIGYPTRWSAAGNAHMVDATLGHVGAVTGTVNLQSYDLFMSFSGFPGEYALDRFARLMNEEGLPYYVTGDAADTEKMGPQRPVTMRQHLEEIRDTDDARIFDHRLDIALRMRTRVSLQRQTPVLELTYPDDIAPPLEEIFDDKAIRNLVTVANSHGGEATAELTTGALSTASWPDGIGERKGKVDVNVYSEGLQLAPLASWYLSKGTIDRARYGAVVVNVFANESLTADCEAADIGDLITIAGLEPEPVRLIILGIEEVPAHIERTFAFTCMPADLYDVAKYDTGSGERDRWSSGTSTVAGGPYTTTSTAITLSTTDSRDCWSTTAEPYDLMIAGERMTCTSMGAASGSGPYTQVATVTRSVNGVVKVPVAGDVVRLADAKRWGI